MEFLQTENIKVLLSILGALQAFILAAIIHPPYLVSQAINKCLEKSFFELINSYRVEEAKRLIQDEKLNHISLVGIGFESGFSSKTAFNTAFKKHTGLTPSEFKRSGIGINFNK